MEPLKIVILYSGGLDSSALKIFTDKNYPNANVKYIYYDYGNPVCESEIENLPNFVEVRSVQWFNKSTEKLVGKDEEAFRGAMYIPGRNLVFATLAACQELPDYIFMGGLYEESRGNATDKNQIFIDKFNDTINYVLSPFKDKIKLRFPFLEMEMTKSDVIGYHIEHGATVENLSKYFHCYNKTENNLNCGNCPNCVKTYTYYLEHGIKIEYESEPFYDSINAWEHILKVIETLENKEYKDIILLFDMGYKAFLQFVKEYDGNYNYFIDETNLIERLSKVVEAKNKTSLNDILI